MKLANAQQGNSAGSRGGAVRPTPIMIVAGIAFLALFVAWIPLHGWIAQMFNTTNDDTTNVGVGITSIVLWLVVFGVVLAAARWSHSVFEGWETRDLLLTAVVGAVFGVLFSLWTGVYASFGTILGPW